MAVSKTNKYLLLLLFFLVNSFVRSQDDRPALLNKENNPLIIRVVLGIPKTISSNQFRTSFNGLYEGHVAVMYRLFKDVYAGAGYQSVYFQNNETLRFKIFKASVPYNTVLIGDCPFVSFSYQKFFRPKAYMEYTFNYGFLLGRYGFVNDDTTHYNKPFQDKKFMSHYIQPQVSANFNIEDHLGFSIFLSYSTLFYRYNPKAPRFNQFEEIRDKSNNYFMSWVTFGFGFNVLLGKIKS